MNASDFDKFCIQHCKDIEELLEENKNLRSQIEYLRRSVERKEETIAELELERVPYTNEYVEELEKENSELKKQLEEANKKLYLCTPEIPRNVHGEYVSYVDLVNEIYKLKKQDGDGCVDLGVLSEEDIIKASSNIIDVLEVGDYVNGSKVHKIGNCLTIILDTEENISWINPDDIKSIVTKEQFEQISYMLGE